MMFKGRSIREVDEYYGINSDRGSHYKRPDCVKIQKAFNKNGIELALCECRELYETYSDEAWCAQWENGIQDLSLDNIFEILLPIFIDMTNDKISRIEQIGDQLIKGGHVNKVEK